MTRSLVEVVRPTMTEKYGSTNISGSDAEWSGEVKSVPFGSWRPTWTEVPLKLMVDEKSKCFSTAVEMEHR